VTDTRVTELGRRQALLARMRNIAREATGDEPVRRVHLTVSRDAITGELERHPSDPVVERLGFEPAWFPVYPVAQQFAEKMHAYTLPRDVENTRAKDLADMVWLTRRHAFSSDALIEAATATFARRASHAWPLVPAEPPAAWARQYASLRKEMALEPATAQQAHEVLVAFLEPVLTGTRGRRWDPSTGSWRP
jgi:predicted nucleotidyltransferase component of viral defense system